MTKPAIERRAVAELRVDDTGEGRPRIIGYAAVFDKLSSDLGGFREKIAPGAFARTIIEDDVRALTNHDSNMVLGRKSAGTLELREDSNGLRVDITPPDTQAGRDTLELVRSGHLDGMSFGFITRKDEWERGEKEEIRTLLDVKLVDVGPVTFPAYLDTSAAVRSLEQRREADKAGAASAVEARRRRLDLEAL